jgi:hypothetical protein
MGGGLVRNSTWRSTLKRSADEDRLLGEDVVDGVGFFDAGIDAGADTEFTGR